ncbi:sigma-70 family RNA polymerase sigma factor [Pelagibius sp. Alg239-R121]|uniref:sigma-70 family RNA polymerase sigma factor n=1 Tax=Pelagibius sp. Alg239-R121 TaxID=2993448 RepID=UPI0024A69E1D|nr:sigma-70 family RNA polymerase sigma factor [Pelagibius sp. Alg239-R121]
MATSEFKDVQPDDRNVNSETWAGFQQRLRGYVGGRVRPDEVDDLVGDILLKLVSSKDGLSAASNPTAWMMRVATNVITDHYRRRAREQRKHAAVSTENTLSVETSELPDVAANTEVTACLTPFIRSLPKLYAEILMLTEIGGKTQPEVARQLGLSLPAVKSRVKRGRTKLKQALLRCCVLELDSRGNIISYQRRRDACGTRC